MYYINIRNKRWSALTVGKAEDIDDAERYMEIYKKTVNPDHIWIATEPRYISMDDDKYA